MPHFILCPDCWSILRRFGRGFLERVLELALVEKLKISDQLEVANQQE